MNSTVLFDPAGLAAVSAQAVALLKLLANPERMQLLCELSRGERCVGELEEPEQEQADAEPARVVARSSGHGACREQ